MIIVTLLEAIFLVLFVIFIIAWTGATVMNSIRQSLCLHDEGVRETRACDAICVKCGKNLGFISSEENKQRKRV